MWNYQPKNEQPLLVLKEYFECQVPQEKNQALNIHANFMETDTTKRKGAREMGDGS